MGWTYGLEELAAVTGAIPAAGTGIFTGVSTDTRTLRRGDVFFALKGEHFDGNQFVEKALDAGAVAAVAAFRLRRLRRQRLRRFFFFLRLTSSSSSFSTLATQSPTWHSVPWPHRCKQGS